MAGSLRCDYHPFREGVMPSWEDAENREGGRLIVKVPKDITAAIWEDMVLALIGEQFQTEDPDEICGAVISVRRGEDSLSLWHKSRRRKSTTNSCVEALKRVLRLGDSFAIDWREHSKSLGLASVKDNRSRPTPTPPKHGDNEPPIPPGGIELPPRDTLDDDRRARDMMRDNNIGGQRYGGGGGRFPRGERVGGGWREGEGEGRRPPPDRKEPPFNRPNRLASFDTHNEAEPTPPSSAKHALGAPPPPRPVGLGGGWGRGKVLRPGGIGRRGPERATRGTTETRSDRVSE
ncbi:unnamed protein product [Vitrella brassicaformis CCMP3155]|uniref:Uncharacterized protein n=1 Tax=Vitrella brassicaformis (strain CCMP3155) TaxID=1169540 RepID=A0A0G4GCZ1_VITBC|nr:unnamed protein product [Vitrella brassicaformis CCMP3155]|eukprot:CEM26698.1 unnamed protein product [Vitrella brassicaformis CCMP3155]